MTGGQISKEVTISSGQTTTARLGRVSVQVCRISEVILFDTAKSFIKPDQKLAPEQAFSFGLTRSASSGGPTPKTNQFLLIVGHTDQVGSKQSNQQLSKRRARAAWAVFTVNASTWEELYQDENWGLDEVKAMSARVDDFLTTNTQRYLHDTQARLDLMRRYLLFLRPSWLPQQSPPLNPNMVSSPDPPILGCGENLPRRNAPGAAVQENRRVEFVFLKGPDSSIRNADDCPSFATYRSWQATCGQFITVQIELLDEYNDPYAGSFDLTLPSGGVLSNEQTDKQGRWKRDGLPAGKYTIKVKGWEITELPAGQKSTPSLEKDLSVKDNSIRAQVINLAKWFVPKQNPLSQIPQFSRGNTVEPLIDGQEMMAAIHKAFTSTRPSKGHYIYVTGWRIDASTPLLGATRSGSEVLPVLLQAIGRGVEVRALLWDAWGAQNTAEQEEIDKEDRKPHRGQAILDNETLNWGSHHQKAAVVNGPNGLVAFCGGIDLATGRWDTPSHTIPNRDRENYPNNPKPWHDIHTRIHGPAAGDIETNFRERWNGHPDRNGNGRTNVPTHSIPKPIPNASHLVQTLRTLPPQQRYPFAPNGELGTLNAYLKAIANAREYIYIEDQYLVFDEISAAVARVMSRLKGQVIIVVNREPEDPFTAPDAFLFHRFDFIEQLRQVNASKIEVYHLRNRAAGRNIFVHSKVMIIDDIWAIIGSANVNRRSMTHDSEISVAVIDGAIEKGRRKFARDLRIRLWTEHLGVNKSQVDDPLQGIKLWSKTAAAGKGHIVVYPRPRGSDSINWNRMYDPDGR